VFNKVGEVSETDPRRLRGTQTKGALPTRSGHATWRFLTDDQVTPGAAASVSRRAFTARAKGLRPNVRVEPSAPNATDTE